MKCPNCGNEMVESRAGHLCISCGHIETSTASSVADSPIATGKDSHDQMAAASAEPATTPAPDPAPSTDAPASDTPAPPVTAAPWETPATDTASAESKPDEESDTTSIKITTPDEKPADAPVPTPSAEDLSAVEKAVAEAAKVTGVAPAEEPADEPKSDSTETASTDTSSVEPTDEPKEEAKDEPKNESTEAKDAEPVKDEPEPADEPKEEVPKESEAPKDEPEVVKEPEKDEPKSDPETPETIVPLAEGVAGAAVAAETSEPSILKHHKVKRHPKHKKDEDKKEDEKPDEKDGQPKEDKPEGSNLTHKDLNLDAPDKIEEKTAEPEKPAESAPVEDKPADPEVPAKNENYSQNTHSTPTPAWVAQAEAKTVADDAPKDESESGSEPLPIIRINSEKSDMTPEAEKPEPDKPEPDAEPKPETPKEDEPSPVVIPSGPDAATTPDSMLTPPPPPEQPPTEQPVAVPAPPPATPQPPLPPTIASNAPLNGKPPLTPTTHPRPVTAKLIISLVAGVLIAGAGAGGVYAYTAAPKLALAEYLQKTVDSKTSNFTLTSTQSSDGHRLAVKLTGKGDVTDPKNPKFDVAVTGELASDTPLAADGTAVSGGLGGHVVLADKAFYFKLDDLSVLKSIMNTKPTTDWYKLDLSKATQADKCSDQTSSLTAIMGKDVLKNVPVKDAKFTGMGKLDGSQAMHYTGTIDNSKLQAVIDSANKKLSADCKFDIKSGDYQNRTIKYELWRGWSKDRLKLTMTNSSNKASGVVTLDTSGYNQPVDIKAPAGAKDAADLFKGVAVLGAATHSVDAPAVAATNPAATDNDARRQADLSLYAAAYKAKAKSGFYPVTPPAIQMSATDPTTGQFYVVSKSAPTAPGQVQYLPGGACTGPAHTPGATGTRYLALYTMLESSSTPYCFDVK